LYRWATPVTLPAGKDAASQCRARDIAPGEIRHVILSHFHADHVAGLHAFPNATIHCARAGLRAMYQSGRFAQTRHGLLRALLPDNFSTRARFFEDSPQAALPSEFAPFTSGADLFGDGALLAIPLPGHCPGHWGLALHDARWGLHFLVGDAAWSLDAIRRNMPPPALISGLLGDTRRTRETLFALHQLMLRNPELRLTPCHCRERAAEVEQAQ
jgi:glyoxylase-like metal-dependent hydrolase (beta-lactamase superfamily II)